MIIEGLEQNHELQSPSQAIAFAPRFGQVAKDLLVAYLSIATLVTGNLILHDLQIELLYRIPAMILSGALVAFLFHFLFLFLHEAGHFNLFPNHKVNDQLGNILVGYWFFQDISLYRRMHWKHHLRHGESDDPENSYFFPMTLGNLLKSLSGVTTLSKVIAWDKAQVRDKKDPKDQAAKIKALCIFGIYNLAVLTPFLLNNALGTYLAVWFVPLFCGFPVFALIRQNCEHRPPGSGSQIFGEEAPRPFTNVFQPTLGAYFIGGAGFRQHWYHHLNPYISYTRLDDFAKEVQVTLPQLTSKVKEVGYLKTFTTLLRDSYKPAQMITKIS